MATPPFAIAETVPADTDLISQYPVAEHTFRDIVESWLTILSDPATGLLKPTALTFPFVITNASVTQVFLQLEATDAGANAGPAMDFYRNSVSPAVSDILGQILFSGKNSAAVKTNYADSFIQVNDVTSTTEDATWTFRVVVAGTLNNRLSMNAAGVTLGGITSVSSLTSSGAITAAGSTTAATSFISSTTAAVLAATGAGTIFLRPNGSGSAVGQATIDASGNVVYAGTLTGGAISATGITASSGNITSTSGSIISGSTVFANVSAGTMTFRPNGAASATAQMTYTAAGNLTAAGDITASSDRRLKKSISGLNGQWAADMVREVQPMTFLRKRSDQRGIGFIAQDVQAYAPELIQTDTRGYLSLAYPNMVAILWKVVQDLQNRLASLEAK